jgi:thioredoxin-related protein
MPLLKELRNKYKEFEVVGVNLDNSKDDMMAFLQANNPGWPQLFDEGGLESRLATQMGIQTLPTMILIDKQGKVVDRNIRAQGLESELTKLLK